MVIVIMYADLKERESEYPFSLPFYSLLRVVKQWTTVRITKTFFTTL